MGNCDNIKEKGISEREETDADNLDSCSEALATSAASARIASWDFSSIN